jgi:hypothetical protein
MVGYGMAALFFRAFWPQSRPTPALGVPGIGLYLWLGLAMSGPIILLRRRPRSSDLHDPRHEPTPPALRTWAELAWLLIGIYWIVLELIVIPARSHEFKPGDMFLFCLIPIWVGLGFGVFGANRAMERQKTRAWTHRAGVALVATWPLAWICLIVLFQTLR